jgi:hypothetical protein
VHLRHDDQLHSVDNYFLGPPGWSLPWKVRYSAYVVGFVVFVAALGLEREAGIGFSFGSFAWGLLLTVAVTTGLMRVVTHDRPLRAIVGILWSELTGPRPPATARHHLEPARIRLEHPHRRFSGGRRYPSTSARLWAPADEPRRGGPPERGGRTSASRMSNHAATMVRALGRSAEQGGWLRRACGTCLRRAGPHRRIARRRGEG